LRAGERHATERFVRQHTGWMLALARRYVKEVALAEDCVQEAFLQAFRGLREFEGRSTLRSWLFRIVLNAALMKLRSHRSAAEEPIDEDMRRGAAMADIVTPEHILQSKQACALVAEKIMALPDNYRIVLLLRDIEGLSTEETARLLATTEGAVKVRLHRARAAFRVLVEPVVKEYV
jgi:RNA polymerase sigma-70 factor (ECF subfamily)